MIIIADSSTLIALLDVGQISLLFDLFGTVVITPEVYREITVRDVHRETITRWIVSGKLSLKSVAHDERYTMLIKRLDPGESESIALAGQDNLPLIIDEKKGRSVARSLGIPIIGLVGILLKLIDKDILSRTEAIIVIEEIEENGFRMSKELKGLIHGN